MAPRSDMSNTPPSRSGSMLLIASTGQCHGSSAILRRKARKRF